MSVVQLERRQLVLFDLDGTLVDTASDMYRAMYITLRDLGWPEVSETQIRQWVGQGTGKLCDAVLTFYFSRSILSVISSFWRTTCMSMPKSYV